MRRALLAVLLLLVAGLASPALAAKRVALVIGIHPSDNLQPLRRAVNDEKTVAATLAGLGSTFIRGENLTRREMNAKLAELDAKIDPGDTVFFFFAGHGGAWCRELSSAARPSEATSFAPHLLEPGQEDLELHLQHYGGQIGCGELRRRQAT